MNLQTTVFLIFGVGLVCYPSLSNFNSSQKFEFIHAGIPACDNHQTVKVLIFCPEIFWPMKSHLFKKCNKKITHLFNTYLHVHTYIQTLLKLPKWVFQLQVTFWLQHCTCLLLPVLTFWKSLLSAVESGAIAQDLCAELTGRLLFDDLFCSINSSSRGANPRVSGSFPEDCAD